MQDWDGILATNQGVFARLGIQVQKPLPTETGQVPTLSLLVKADMVNSSNLCHGGILYALADTACAWALLALERQPATVDASITYISAAKLGETIVAQPELLKNGRRTGSCTVALLGHDERLVASYRGTCAYIDG